MGAQNRDVNVVQEHDGNSDDGIPNTLYWNESNDNKENDSNDESSSRSPQSIILPSMVNNESSGKSRDEAIVDSKDTAVRQKSDTRLMQALKTAQNPDVKVAQEYDENSDNGSVNMPNTQDKETSSAISKENDGNNNNAFSSPSIMDNESNDRSMDHDILDTSDNSTRNDGSHISDRRSFDEDNVNSSTKIASSDITKDN